MRERLFILITAIFFSVGMATAKPQKIKYGKYVEYVGTVSEKTPNGVGSLTIFSRINKKEPLLVINGQFSVEPDMILKVRDAVVCVSDGLSFATQLLDLRICKAKDAESINLEMSNFEIISPTNRIYTENPSSIKLDWEKEKQNKEWKYKIIESGEGYITSNFMQLKYVYDPVTALHVNPVKQKISYDIVQVEDTPLSTCLIKPIGIQEVYFDSGLKVDVGEEPVYCFPNGNIIKYKNTGVLSSLSLTLEDGSISSEGNKLVLNFNNGDRFEGDISQGLFMPYEDYLQIKSLEGIKIKNGVFYHSKDNISDTYSEGKIVERRLPDGIISFGKDNKYFIKYNNGNVFTGTDSEFIKNYSDFPNFKNASEAILFNGKLKKTNSEYDIYSIGEKVGGNWLLADGGYVEYKKNSPVKLKYPDGNIATGEFDVNNDYSPKMESSDYTLTNGWITFEEGNTLNFHNGIPVLKNEADVYWYADSKGYKVLRNKLHYDYSELMEVRTRDNHIVINALDNAKQLNDNVFYIKAKRDHCFSYPKSYITKGYNSYNKPVLEAESCEMDVKRQLREDPAWPGDVKTYLIWVYNPVTVKDGIEYCDTKGLFIMDKKTDAIIYDMSETFKKGHNRSFKKVLPAPKKKTYHKKGRIENCGVCLGTGQGWGSATFCPFCGGKGWYIEHKW